MIDSLNDYGDHLTPANAALTVMLRIFTSPQRAPESITARKAGAYVVGAASDAVRDGVRVLTNSNDQKK